jgi:hypothetical protein
MILLSVLVLLLALTVVGSAPVWPYSREWGIYPSSGTGVLLAIVLTLLAMGRLHP